MTNNYQRKGSKSNTQAGNDFELAAVHFFKGKELELERNLTVQLGVDSNKKKPHRFDLGSSKKGNRVIVECKSHRWTSGDNVPSAKMTVWNEAMYYFKLAPDNYRKIMFVLRDYSKKKKMTLAGYYLDTYRHLIPRGVEFWEYDEKKKVAKQLNLG